MDNFEKMMKASKRISGGGIKCDNPICDYVDQTVEISDYKNWVNHPCPKCGGNLLTEDDFECFQLILKVMDGFAQNEKVQ